VPQEKPPRLFLRFLKFGALAWGGPVAQIAMIRQEIVEQERWISREQFNRVLAVYQVLPGPEAHELCVYFGMLAGGRLGGFLAGLGFMLPGFLLMFALSALYVGGIESPLWQAVFLGVQPVVLALIVRAVVRIGQHALTNPWLWGAAAAAAAAQLVGVSFWITLSLTGVFFFGIASRRLVLATVAAVLLAAGIALAAIPGAALTPRADLEQGRRGSPTRMQQAPMSRLFTSGLRAGLLTFGGAYTVLPFLQHDAVEAGRWMTPGEFLDGVAISGVLPAPFIIFSTFVGYLGGGPLGALALTVGIFLPAFGFTLLGHSYVERLVQHRSVHSFLDGVTAGVVGLIAATSFTLFQIGVRDARAAGLFLIGFGLLSWWRVKWAVAAVMLGAAVVSMLPLVF
jgi:chromate transporter